MGATNPEGTVLVVDNDAPILETLHRILSSKGCRVDVARSGAEAIDLVQQAEYDLVLIDLVMPAMDGLETLRRLREIRPALPALTMTAYPDSPLIKQAEAAGLSVLVKPFEMGELLRHLRSGSDFSTAA